LTVTPIALTGTAQPLSNSATIASPPCNSVVYALERVARDSERDRRVAFEVLSAFIRQRTKSAFEVDHSGDESPDRVQPRDEPPEPVLAALSVLRRRPPNDSSYPAPDLRGFRWRGADLGGANLTEADLTEATGDH
jgi:hypothetical protein